jgi:hypothetical protein
MPSAKTEFELSPHKLYTQALDEPKRQTQKRSPHHADRESRSRVILVAVGLTPLIFVSC